MNRDTLFPYLTLGLVEPEWGPAAVELGHGIYATLFADRESGPDLIQTPVGPDALRAAGLTPDEAHRIALDNLLRFAEADDRMSVQVLGRPGDAVTFLLYSDHPRASACLRLPDLYDHARELLETDDLCACVPQRESLVVLPKRDRAYRESVVAKLREIEADVRHPLGFGLFDLSPAGVRPFVES